MYVIIDEDIKTAIEPYTGIIAEIDTKEYITNLSEIIDKIDRLDDISYSLLDSLDPNTLPLISYPNREGIYLNLGRITNFVYGFIAGLLIGIIIIGVLK